MENQSRGSKSLREDDWIPIKSKRARASDIEFQNLSLVPLGTLENNNLIAARPAREAFGVSLAGSFGQDFHAAPHQGFKSARGDLIDYFQQSLVPLFAHGLRHLVGHGGRRRVSPFGVFEDIRLVEFHFAREGKGFLEVGFGFAGEADDEISAQADVGLHAPEFVDDLEIADAGVAAVHQFEDAVAAALDGEMRAFYELP